MAFQTAARAGIQAREFWELTPYLTRLRVEAWLKDVEDRRKGDMSIAWCGAYLQRLAKMPSLERFLGIEKAPEELAAKIKAVLGYTKNGPTDRRPKS